MVIFLFWTCVCNETSHWAGSQQNNYILYLGLTSCLSGLGNNMIKSSFSVIYCQGTNMPGPERYKSAGRHFCTLPRRHKSTGWKNNPKLTKNKYLFQNWLFHINLGNKYYTFSHQGNFKSYLKIILTLVTISSCIFGISYTNALSGVSQK